LLLRLNGILNKVQMEDIQENYLISIVLPVYNGQEFLSDSIKSCISQTHKNWELIIVNDASVDNSLVIANKFASEDNRIKIISNTTNQKLPACLNIGHKAANGRFITWTSDDNCYKPTALKSMLIALLKQNADLVFADFNIIDSEGKIIGANIYNSNHTILLENIIRACFLYRKEVFKRNDGYDEDLFKIEDFAFWQMASQHSNFIYLPENLYFYRSHANSLTAKKTISQFNYKPEYNNTVRKMYFKFFKSFGLKNLEYLSELFAKFHLHQEINIYEFLKKYSQFRIDMSEVLKFYGEEEILKQLDVRIRYNILKNKSNQNIKTLILIAIKRPYILLNYSKKRSLYIIFRLLFNRRNFNF